MIIRCAPGKCHASPYGFHILTELHRERSILMDWLSRHFLQILPLLRWPPPTSLPTSIPTINPTTFPTTIPTSPTNLPTINPSTLPTTMPTSNPSPLPTASPNTPNTSNSQFTTQSSTVQSTNTGKK